MRKQKWSDRIFRIVNTVFMILLMIITLYPFWYVAMASFSDSNALMAHTGLLLKPLHFNLNAYRMVAKNPNLLSGYTNTILIVVVGTLSSTIMTAIGAYVMSRKPFPFQKAMMLMMIFTMYFYLPNFLAPEALSKKILFYSCYTLSTLYCADSFRRL